MEHGSAVERYEAFQRLKKKFEVKNERDRPQHSKEILSRNDHFIAGEYSSEKSNTMNEQNSKVRLVISAKMVTVVQRVALDCCLFLNVIADVLVY